MLSLSSPGMVTPTQARASAFICYCLFVFFHILRENTEVMLNSPIPNSPTNNYSYFFTTSYILIFLSCQEMPELRNERQVEFLNIANSNEQDDVYLNISLFSQTYLPEANL